MQQYYTLREAAEKLKMDAERLKDMAKSNQLRAFQDRGNLRFRVEEIDEMARSLGHGSDPDLQLSDLAMPKPAKSPPPGKTSSGKSPPPSSRRTMHVPADADLSLVGEENEQVPIGDEPPSQRSSGPKTPSGKSKPPSSRKSGNSPAPKPGSDSDVRLVADGSDLDFQIADDAQTKEHPAAAKSPKDAKSKVSKTAPEGKPDSGARVIPKDKASDSDVKMVPDDRADDANVALGAHGKTKTASDSDVRLEGTSGPTSGRGGAATDPFVTEEIELDLEAMKAEEKKKAKRKTRPSKADLPTSSPFELSEDDVEGKGSKTGRKKTDEDSDSSSDFELAPGGGDSSASDELTFPLADDSEVGLAQSGGKTGQASGINLRDPKDSGISLEEGGSEELDFIISNEPGSTPKPKAGCGIL